MATTIRMPEVLANATEAAIQAWLVAVGDEVAIGQPLAEIETDKAVVQYAAETAGTVLQLLVPEGESVDVGKPIAIVGAPGETPPASPEDVDDSAAAQVLPDTEGSEDGLLEGGDLPAAEPQREPDREPDEANTTGRRFMSPLVRRLAREHGLDLDGVKGTGPEGRIVRRDIEPMLTGERAAAPSPAPAPAASAEAELVPHSRMRKAIARRLTESKNTVPHFYLMADCRVDRLLELRRQINEPGTVKVSVNDLVVKAVAAAFADVPEANVTWSDEGMLRHSSVDIAIAVSVDDGLVTPVLRGVDTLSLTDVNAGIAELAERGRAGKLRQHELEGGSFAVSNLGMYGTKEFSAIINPPQSGILAVGAARREPVVEGDELVAGTVMTVTLSADHRALDGALAARWLAAFVKRIENPITILV